MVKPLGSAALAASRARCSATSGSTRTATVAVVSVEEVSVSREFKDVPVTVTNTRERPVSLDPATADITLSGPQRILHNFKFDDGALFVDADELEPGTHKVQVQVTLPATLEVSRRRPDQHTLAIVGGP